MKKVLLLGDSIRLGYGQRTAELLSDVAEVVQPEENCRWTKYLFWNFLLWADDTKYDLIHWNSGIWDLHHIDNDEPFCTADEYIRDNERLLSLIRKYSDNLVWATTIPGGKVLDERRALNALLNTDRTFPVRALTTGQKIWNKGIQEFNAAAADLFRRNGVEIDDLYSVMSEHLEDYISGDGIHPNEAGYEALAQQVAGKIRSLL